MSCTDCNDISIPIGNNGTNGTNGIFGGYSSSWNFDSNLPNTPGLTDFRLNATNPTLVTEVYVNTTNSESIIIAAFLASFTNSGSFGNIRIFDKTNSAIFHYYRITGSALVGNVYTFTVTYISGSGTTPLVNNSIGVISFSERGLDGTNGTNGTSMVQLVKDFEAVVGPGSLTVTNAELNAVFGATPHINLIYAVWFLQGTTWENITTLYNQPSLSNSEITVVSNGNAVYNINFTIAASSFKIVVLGLNT